MIPNYDASTKHVGGDDTRHVTAVNRAVIIEKHIARVHLLYMD